MKNQKIFLNNRSEIILIISLSILSLIFWESYLVIPIKVFVVLIHEISHTVVSLFSGGSVEYINFTFNFDGITKSKGGNLLFIASSGYIGSLLIGIILFLSSNNEKSKLWFTTFLAIVLILVAVNLMKGGYQTFLCLLIAIFFFILPRYTPKKMNIFFLKLIGLTSSLYVIIDIRQDLLTTTLRETDTQILEYLTGIPAMTIGISWFFISIIAVFFLLRKEIKI